MSAHRPTAAHAADRRIANLERLAALLAGGALSREEFEREKRLVLEGRIDAALDPPGAASRGYRHMRRGGRSAGIRLGWFILGLALLALVVWITLASPDPHAGPVLAIPAATRGPGQSDGASAAPSPALLAGGWVDERLGCSLSEKDRFEYFGADGRYGSWGGFGGITDEGRWALNGTRLVETITHHTGNNEARPPERLPEPQVRAFEIASPAPDHLVVTGATGGTSRLLRCPDARFAFAARG